MPPCETSQCPAMPIEIKHQISKVSHVDELAACRVPYLRKGNLCTRGHQPGCQNNEQSLGDSSRLAADRGAMVAAVADTARVAAARGLASLALPVKCALLRKNGEKHNAQNDLMRGTKEKSDISRKTTLTGLRYRTSRIVSLLSSSRAANLQIAGDPTRARVQVRVLPTCGRITSH